MSILKRRILTIIFFLFFLVLAPLLVFYASGNILGENWNILATGGMFIKSMESGSKLFVNGKLKDTTGFFTRDCFLKNLKPGVYTVLVKKDGYNDWVNKIKVSANQVVESNVFMLPTEINVMEISEFSETEKIVGTTTKINSKNNSDYEMVKNFFSDTLILEKYISIFSTSTGKIVKYAPGVKENPIENRHFFIWSTGPDVFVGWNGKADSSPKIFCQESKNEINCQSQLKIYSFEANVKNIGFFPGESEVVVVVVDNKIYAIEAEENPEKKPQILYNGQEPDFRVYNNTIYIKDNNFFGQVDI